MKKKKGGTLDLLFPNNFTFNQRRKHCQLRLMFHHDFPLLCICSCTHRVCDSPIVTEESCSQTTWIIPVPPFFLTVLPACTYSCLPQFPSPADPSSNTKVCMVYSPPHFLRSCTHSSGKAGLLPLSPDLLLAWAPFALWVLRQVPDPGAPPELSPPSPMPLHSSLPLRCCPDTHALLPKP